ncbi:hypothetical protein DF213_21820 [Dickeya dianthicola]|uniref:Uncharacterized protein n=2 Tax=Dickeya dianthicola TaxID=204039 RepID=A0AAX1C068_9GAMM|nr:hypothetical protein DF213_21820 [Dickeya dianthicola]
MGVSGALLGGNQQSVQGRSARIRYIEREGGIAKEERAMPTTDAADTASFEERGGEDRHQFRFIVSPEEADFLDTPQRAIACGIFICLAAI